MKSTITFLLLSFTYFTHAQYTNLVLEGGGMKGIAYAGAFEVLDSLGISDSIQHVAGTSSGAMNGMMFALGYTGKEIHELNLQTNFGRYNQVGFPVISGLIRLRKTYGYYKTDRFIGDLGKLMEAKGFSKNLTFEELYNAKKAGKNVKLLYITGANLSDQKIEIFSHETYPKMKVLDAVRISISIPVYFEALFMQPDGQLIEKKDADATTKVMVDGGILDNYPFYLFDSLVLDNYGEPLYYKANPKTLGLKLETDSSNAQIATISIKRQSNFMQAFTRLGSENLNRRYLGAQQKAQTVFINTHNFNPKVKKQRQATKEAVMQYGKEAALNFFSSQD